MFPSRYTFELWTPQGVKTAELSGLADNRRLTLTRNDTEDISWRLDLNEIKRLAKTLNTTWRQLIQKGITEVRIRRGKKYLCGGVVSYTNVDRSSKGEYIDVRARGFLDLFADRYTPALVTYTAMDRTAIAADLINVSQGYGTNWNFGVTIGSQPSIGLYSRQYQNVRIKDALQDLTKLQLAFDFAFTPDKVFNMYTAIGTRRRDVIFSYPGNCENLSVIGDATSIQNRLYLLGTGIGQDAAVQITMDDATSQANYKVREKPVLLSDTLDSGTLQDYGYAQLSAWSFPFDIPSVEYLGGRGPAVTDYTIGDYVWVQEMDDPDTDVNGFFRVEQIAISLDANDTETIKVSFGR